MQTVNITLPTPPTPGETLQINIAIAPVSTLPHAPKLILPGARGADISRHNTITDWGKLSAEIEFLFIRATMGAAQTDSQYKNYWAAAKAAGVKHLGIYHLFIKEASPVSQVDNIFRATGGDFGGLPIVLDIETRTNEVVPENTRPQVAQNLMALVAEIEKRGAKTPIIYTSKEMWRCMIGPSLGGSIARCPLFVADYSGPIDMPLGWGNWAFHQRGVMRPTWATGDIDDDICAGF